MASEKTFRTIDYVKITIFGAGLSVLWPTLHTIVIPTRLLELVPEAQKNTYLGLMTFAGLLLAMLVQPIVGAFSDRFSSGMGRRRPFILAGTILALIFLPGIGLAGSFIFLFAGYCLLQISSNIAQGPFQAFIPDLVPHKHRGVASAVKTLVEVLASVALLRLAAYFIDTYTTQGGEVWLWAAIGFPGIILLVTMISTMVTVRERPSVRRDESSAAAAVARAFRIDSKRNPGFVWFLLSRLFIFMALGTLEGFALYFIRDVIQVANPSAVAADLLIAVGVFLLLAIYPSGRLSDRFGRKPIIFFSGCVGVIAILVLFFAHGHAGIIVCGALLGISTGAFLSSNWALATDLVPKGEEARYLGLANLATAGAGALSRLIGPVIDFFNGRQAGLGYSVMLLVCILYFVLGSALVIPVRRRAEGSG